MSENSNKEKATTATQSHRGILLPRGGSSSSSAAVGAPPLFSVDSTPERHVVRESTSFVRRVNEWIAGESRRDAGLLRTLQNEHHRSGDAAWKAMIESDILVADDDVQVAAAAFRRLDADRVDDDENDDDRDEWRRDFDRLMDQAAAGASSEHAKVSEQLAAQAAALREQRAAAAAAATTKMGEDEIDDADVGVDRRISAPEQEISAKADDEDDGGNTGDDDKDEFFDVDEEMWEKEPSPLRMRR